MNRRNFIATAAAVAVCGAASSPLVRAQTNSVKRGGTLRVSIGQAVAKLNPLQARVTPEYLVAELLYSGLTRLGEGLSPVPDLALSWTSSPDLKVWTFALRRGVVFHDGTPFTSADVVASFHAILDPKVGSPGSKNVGPIASIQAVDPYTVVFTLSSPYIDFPTVLAFPNAKIAPATLLTAGGDKLSRQAVGTGPFKLLTFQPDRLVSVTRNADYYDKDRPYVDAVEVRVYPDPTAEGSALIAGDIDLMTLVQPTEFGRLQSSPDVDAMRLASGQFCNVVMGCNQKPFNDIRVRKALALTVDRKVMVDFIAEGYGAPGNDSPISNAYNFYSAQPLKLPDLVQAKKLLADAGYPNGIKMTLIASDNPEVRTQLGVALREMSKPAGFDIDVQTMPHATYLEQVWKKGPFYVGLYNMQPTEDAVFSLLFTSNAPWNETHWNNKAFDKLVHDARETADIDKRRSLYAEAQRLISEEVPSVIPVFFDLLRAKRHYVKGYKVHPRGLVFRLDYVSLDSPAAATG